MQVLRILKDVLQQQSISVLKFSNETGIPSPRVYKWLNGTGNPKTGDMITIQRWLAQKNVELEHGMAAPATTTRPNPLAGKTSTEWRIIRYLINEIASLRAEVSGREFQDCLKEMEEKIDVIAN